MISAGWLSVAFTLTVIANFAAMAQRNGGPPLWVTHAPLPPLALLPFTGLCLFALPYFRRARLGRSFQASTR